jgi:hypothetical protein
VVIHHCAVRDCACVYACEKEGAMTRLEGGIACSGGEKDFDANHMFENLFLLRA